MDASFPPETPPTGASRPGERLGVPAVPGGFHGFCARCFYSLRGLAEARCPECGKSFDPADPRTFSFTPRSDRLRKAARRTASSILEALKSFNPPDPETARRAAAAGQLVELQLENTALRRQIETLKALLLAKGILDPADLEAIDREAEQAILGPAIVDDTEPQGEKTEGMEPSADLLELGRAAQQRDGSA